jgi:hypothetical protein
MSEATQTATLNGIELTGIGAARDALDHYNADYNDGELHEAEGGKCLIVVTRTARFQHFSLFRDCERLKIGNVRAIEKGDDVRMKVEIREVSR